MQSSTPVRDGFRAVFGRPSIILGEISWRWCFGAAFWALVILSATEYLGSLTVSPLNWLMWKTGFPPLMTQAFADTIHGSGFKLVRIAAVLLPGCSVLWILAAAFGRTATLRALLPLRTVRFRTILGLSFLRSALTVAAGVGVVGAFALSAFVYSDGPGTVPHAGRAMAILFVLGALISYLWTTLNWFLSLAPVLAVVRGEDALASVSSAVNAFGERKRAFIGVSSAFGALHFLAFLVGTGISFFALGLASLLPFKVLLAVFALLCLIYFAVADWLYMARLAAYVALVSREDVDSGIRS